VSNIGRKLGYCGSVFGHLEFGPHRIEAEGWDWVVVRRPDGRASFASWGSNAEKEAALDDCDYANEPQDGE